VYYRVKISFFGKNTGDGNVYYTNTSDGNVGGGVSKVMELSSPKGGTALSGMMEAFAQTEAGRSVLAKLGLKQQDKDPPPSPPKNAGFKNYLLTKR